MASSTQKGHKPGVLALTGGFFERYKHSAWHRTRLSLFSALFATHLVAHRVGMTDFCIQPPDLANIAIAQNKVVVTITFTAAKA